jgi:hypothetical protein
MADRARVPTEGTPQDAFGISPAKRSRIQGSGPF